LVAVDVFDGCPVDNWLVSWRYFISGLEIFEGCPGDIRWMNWRYLIAVLKVFDMCPGDIFGRYPGDI